jgi:4-carboxymuconolactone decarboxylase
MTEVRFRPLSDAELNAEQRQLVAAVTAGPRKAVRGPFHALMRAPQLALLVERVGEHVRFKNVLPAPLKELVIIITARHWGAQYEWYAHRRDGIAAGLAPDLCDAVGQGKRPANMSADEAIVYNFATELFATHEVSDATFAVLRDRFGERGVVELICTMGHYTTVALILNTDRHPLPPDATPMPKLG